MEGAPNRKALECPGALAGFLLGRPSAVWQRALRLVLAVGLMALIFWMSNSSKPPGRALAKATLGHSLSRDSELHFMVYAMLAAALVWGLWPNFRRARWSFLLAAVISVAYAALDELHQSLVPGRTAAFRDLLIDWAGVLAACVLLGGGYLAAKLAARRRVHLAMNRPDKDILKSSETRGA